MCMDALSLLLFLVVLALVVYIIRLKASYGERFRREIERIRFESQLQAEQSARRQAEMLYTSWLTQHAQSLEGSIRKEYETKLQEWRLDAEKEIRRDAVVRSISTILGRVGEEFAPFYLVEELGVNPKDFRHIGTPVDYIAFKGLSDDVEPEIIFVEVKTGQASILTERERKVRDAVANQRVRYVVVNLAETIQGVRNRVLEEAERLFETSDQKTWVVDRRDASLQ